MIILLLAYHFAQSSLGDAGPIPLIEQRDIASGDDQAQRRTLYGITWSCLTTIFLCTWVSIHPNIAFRPEKHNASWFEEWIRDPLQHFVSYKLPLFFWALLVPEYILAWSVRQYVKAGEIQKQVPGWTRTHGFFMIMGGFHQFRLPDGASSLALPLDRPSPAIRSPVSGVYAQDSVSVGKMENKNQGGSDVFTLPDGVASVMVPQSLSPSDFIIPLGDHSTEDEIPVRPLQLQHIPINILKVITPTEAELKDRGKSDALTKFIVLLQTSWFIIQCIARGIQHLPLTELEIVTLAYGMMNFFIYVFWWDKPRNVGCPIRVYRASGMNQWDDHVEEWKSGWTLGLLERVYMHIVGRQDGYSNLSRASSVPMFWSGNMDEDPLLHASFGPSVLGAAFGAIHFIAWLSEFPSYTESILWRISCIAMTAVPFASAVTCVMLGYDLERLHWVLQLFGYAAGLVSVTTLVLCSWLYVVARLATLVIAFTTLRSVHSAALSVVDWTTFIPHI